MGDNWGTAGGAGGDSSVNQVILVTHSRNPLRVDGKILLKGEADNVLRAYDTAVVLRMIGLRTYLVLYLLYFTFTTRYCGTAFINIL